MPKECKTMQSVTNAKTCQNLRKSFSYKWRTFKLHLNETLGCSSVSENVSMFQCHVYLGCSFTSLLRPSFVDWKPSSPWLLITPSIYKIEIASITASTEKFSQQWRTDHPNTHWKRNPTSWLPAALWLWPRHSATCQKILFTTLTQISMILLCLSDSNGL